MTSLGHNNLDDLSFAFAVILCTCIIGHNLRSLVNTYLTWIDVSYKRIVLEFINTAIASVVGFELSYIIWEHYSIFFFLLGLFLYFVYETWPTPHDQATEANPVYTFRLYLRHEAGFTLGMTLIYIIAQTLGALAAYVVIVKPAWQSAGVLGFIWRTENTLNLHTDKIMQNVWQTAVLPENPKLSAASEAFVTFLMYLIEKFMGTLHLDPIIEKYATLSINTLVYATGAPYSGAIYNPAVATALELAMTSGVDVMVKIWVYWVAPLFGISLAVFLEHYGSP